MLDKTEIAPTTEAQDRDDLAACFRLAERYGFHEGICNHFSMQLDGDQEAYLINPYGVHWSEMRGEDLLKIDGDGTILAGDGEVEDSAKFIHIAGHRANRRHKVLLHTHMPYATALTMIEDGRLEMAHQTAVRYFGRIAYQDQFGGLVHGEEEGERLAQTARDHQHVDVTFLANHGVVVGAPTVALAFDDLYYLERACRQHIFAMQTGKPLKIIPNAMVEETAQQYQRDMMTFSEAHFRALVRVMDNNPDRVFTF